MGGFATYDKGGGIPGTVVYADNVDFTGTGRTNTITTNGQLLIGSTAANAGGNHINVGNITSPLGTVTIGYSTPNITIDVAGGSAPISKINVQTGTSPILPTAGAITLNGTTVAAGTNPIRTDGTASDTIAIEVQRSQALAAADATKVGLSNFDSASFAVAATGFVTLVPKAVVIAYLTTGLSNVTGDNTSLAPLIFDTTITNIGAAYNTGTGIFTAPVTGDYLVTVNIMFNNLSTNHASGNVQFFRPVGGTLQSILFNPGLNATANTGYTSVYSATLSGIVHLTAAQQFEIVCSVNNGTKTVGIQGNTFANDTSLSIVQL